MNSEKKKRRISKGNIIYIIVLFLLLAFCTVTYLSAGNTAFCDWWKMNVFTPYTDLASGIASGSKTSWGLMIAFVLLLYLLGMIVTLFLSVFLRTDSFKRFRNRNFKCILVIFLSIILLYEAMWYIPRNATFLNGSYTQSTPVTGENLLQLYQYLDREISDCEQHLSIDYVAEKVVPPGHEENISAIRSSAKKLSTEFPYLKGEYPDAKIHSGSLLEMLLYSQGIYSFTLPLTGEMYMYTDYVDGSADAEFAFRILEESGVKIYTHELAHHKGYFRESEAEFISYKICTESDDPYIRYCGLKQACALVGYELKQRDYLFDYYYSDDFFDRSLTGPMNGHEEEFGWKMEKKISGDKIYDDVLSLIVEDYLRNKKDA